VCHESGFLGKCIGCRHVGFGRCRRAVEFQDSLRRLNQQELASKQDLVSRRRSTPDPFRGGGSLRFLARAASRSRIKHSTKVHARIWRATRRFRKALQKRVTLSQRCARLPKTIDGSSDADQNRAVSPTSIEFGVRTFACKRWAAEKLFGSRPHAFKLLSDDRGARYPRRGGGLRALSTGQSDVVDLRRPQDQLLAAAADREDPSPEGGPAGPHRRRGPSSRLSHPKAASRRRQRRAIMAPYGWGRTVSSDEERAFFHPRPHA